MEVNASYGRQSQSAYPPSYRQSQASSDPGVQIANKIVQYVQQEAHKSGLGSGECRNILQRAITLLPSSQVDKNSGSSKTGMTGLQQYQALSAETAQKTKAFIFLSIPENKGRANQIVSKLVTDGLMDKDKADKLLRGFGGRPIGYGVAEALCLAAKNGSQHVDKYINMFRHEFNYQPTYR